MTPVTHEKLPSKAAPGQLTVKEIQSVRSAIGIYKTKDLYLFGSPVKKVNYNNVVVLLLLFVCRYYCCCFVIIVVLLLLLFYYCCCRFRCVCCFCLPWGNQVCILSFWQII